MKDNTPEEEDSMKKSYYNSPMSRTNFNTKFLETEISELNELGYKYKKLNFTITSHYP